MPGPPAPREPRPLSQRDLVRQVEALGVERGGVLLVHTSFRAVRPVDGGVEGLVRALEEALGPRGTLVMPSWTGDRDEPFDPGRTQCDGALGVTPEVFRRLPGVERSGHPHAFAARGPRAAYVLQDDLPLPPHIPSSPVGRVYDLDGQVLLLGVGHEADTTIHLAECIAGVPYGLPKRCTVMRDGRPVRVEYRENDHCCRRFALVDDWLRAAGAQREGRVGYAVARLASSRAVVGAVVDRLRVDPLIFLHEPGSGCGECRSARESVGAH